MGQYSSVPSTLTLSSITTAAAEIAAVESAITDLETAVGTYAGGDDLSTDVAALETAVGTYAGAATLAADVAGALEDVTSLETAVGTYGGAEDLSTDVAAALVSIGTPATVSTETDLFAICAALEVRIGTLEGA